MATAVHLLVPSLCDPSVARGGMNFYRSTAAVLTAIGPVVSYEVTNGHTEDKVEPLPGVDVVRATDARGLWDALIHRVRAGDLVVKFVGAVGVDDWRMDLWVARLARERVVGAVYMDPDAPSRLALLGDGAHLRMALRDYAAVVLFAGGARAIHQYRRIAPIPCWHTSAALTVRALGDPLPPDRQEYDVLFSAAGRGSREVRAVGVIQSWLRKRPDLRVVLVGHWPKTSIVDGRTVTRQPYSAFTELSTLYRRSRFVVNMLRRDFAGYADTAPARLFEAAWAGAVLVTEPFPGLANYLEPELECFVSADLSAAVGMTDMPERRRREIGARAQQRVNADATEAARHLVDFLATIAAGPAGGVP